MRLWRYNHFIFSGIKNSLFRWLPSVCPLCQEPISQHDYICSPCKNNLPYITKACPYCGKKLPNDISICGDCLQKEDFIIDDFVAPFHYDFPISKLIIDLKFHKKIIHAAFLGRLMAEHLKQRTELPECIIPVPLHTTRLKERGYNQALEIARPISKKLNIPIDIKSCQRIRATKAQASIPSEERKQNMRNAFAVTQEISYQHVAILDDVTTTGHTITALAKTLRQAGVKQISVWCCAKTLKDSI